MNSPRYWDAAYLDELTGAVCGRSRKTQLWYSFLPDEASYWEVLECHNEQVIDALLEHLRHRPPLDATVHDELRPITGG